MPYYARGTVLFWRPRNPWQRIVQWGDAAEAGQYHGFAHCAVALGDGTETTNGSAMQAKQGARVGAYGFTTPDATVAFPGDVARFMGALRYCVGMPYDLLGTVFVVLWPRFGVCVDPSYARTDTRFCSSLVIDAIRRSQPDMLPPVARSVPTRAVSPDQVYNWLGGV